MVTTLQRVAMAIGSGWLAAGEPPLDERRWNRLSQKLRTELLGEARLALLAIRYPDQYIVDAGREAMGRNEFRDGWTAAVNAILTETA